MEMKNTVYAADIGEWRAWLTAHHRDCNEVWLIFPRKESGRPSVAYDEALDEALCFGWIDSIIQKIDDSRYARKFTPRRDTEKWSAVNLRRMQRLHREGRLLPSGLAVIAPELLDDPQAAERATRPRELEVPAELQEALADNAAAREFFAAIAPSHRRRFCGWVGEGKKEETRRKRSAEAVRLLEGKRLLEMK